MFRKIWAVLTRFGEDAPPAAGSQKSTVEKFREQSGLESQMAQERAEHQKEEMGRRAQQKEIEIPLEGLKEDDSEDEDRLPKAA